MPAVAGRRDETSRGRKKRLRNTASCEKPPVATTTPRRAAIRRSREPWRMTTPPTRSPCIDEVLDIGAEENLDLPRQQRGIEPRRERVAEMQRRAAPTAQPLQRVLRDQRAARRVERNDFPARRRCGMSRRLTIIRRTA